MTVNEAVDAEKSWGEGVIKADYGKAEGRIEKHICLRRLMSGGWES